MSNNLRLVLALVMTGVLAALAIPEFAAKLPAGVAPGVAAALAAVLHKMDAQKKCEHKPEDDASSA